MNFTDKAQFKNGKDVEAWLDHYFEGRGWIIEHTTQQEERSFCLGDRHFKRYGHAYTIEYKSGIQTFHTGNIFLETLSVDTDDKLGWLYTCQADYLFYATLLNGTILIFKPDNLRAQVERLRMLFRVVATSHSQNDGYNSHGLLVPYEYAVEKLADKVIRI